MAFPRALTRLWPLLALTLIILFPFGWLGEVVPSFGLFTGWLFGTVEAHAAGHITQFVLLGLALLLIFPVLRQKPWLYVGILLAVAVGQECFQLVYKQRPIVFDDLRDLVTDMVGIAIALGLIQLAHRLRMNR
jgi:hypothetical protein